MRSKYLAAVEKAVNEFWIENKRPPGTRDIMKICHINSTSHVMTLFRALPDTKIIGGRPVPNWVFDAIESHEKTLPVCR